jgi:hypothetical protein
LCVYRNALEKGDSEMLKETLKAGRLIRETIKKKDE